VGFGSKLWCRCRAARLNGVRCYLCSSRRSSCRWSAGTAGIQICRWHRPPSRARQRSCGAHRGVEVKNERCEGTLCNTLHQSLLSLFHTHVHKDIKHTHTTYTQTYIHTSTHSLCQIQSLLFLVLSPRPSPPLSSPCPFLTHKHTHTRTHTFTAPSSITPSPLSAFPLPLSSPCPFISLSLPLSQTHTRTHTRSAAPLPSLPRLLSASITAEAPRPYRPWNQSAQRSHWIMKKTSSAGLRQRQYSSSSCAPPPLCPPPCAADIV